jgi:hypothetical protein
MAPNARGKKLMQHQSWKEFRFVYASIKNIKETEAKSARLQRDANT